MVAEPGGRHIVASTSADLGAESRKCVCASCIR